MVPLLSAVPLSGRFRPGKDKPDPKTWKANFRCALNSLPDICELQEHSRKRGNNAYRVYRMLPSVHTHRRRRGEVLQTDSQVLTDKQTDSQLVSCLARLIARQMLQTVRQPHREREISINRQTVETAVSVFWRLDRYCRQTDRQITSWLDRHTADRQATT